MTLKSITVTLLALSIYSTALAFENFPDKIFTRDSKVSTNDPLIELPEILKTKHINNKFMIYRKNNSKDKGELFSAHGFSQKIEKTPETVIHTRAIDLKIKTSSHSYLKNNKAIVITNYEILAGVLYKLKTGDKVIQTYTYDLSDKNKITYNYKYKVNDEKSQVLTVTFK